MAEDLRTDELARCFEDPLRFALWALPWGDAPELSIVPLPPKWRERYPNCKYGPDEWTCELFDSIAEHVKRNGFDGLHSVPPLKVAIASGHGIGKSFTTALIVMWLLATRPNCKGVVTATTGAQLETKTWAEICKWLKKSLVADMFEINATSIRAKEAPDAWRIDAYTCKEENSEAFAGQHSASSSSFYIFDEASGVPDKIWEVAEGGMTDGEPFFFAFGNPTRNTGRFRECFGRRSDSWLTRHVDSRKAYVTNKETIEAWRQEYGEDSDFFRVRVLGEFPNASTKQFISSALVDEAIARELDNNKATCAIVGVDVARFGEDDSVIYTRIGKGYLPIKTFHNLDSVQLAARVAAHYSNLRRLGLPPERIYINIDETGVGGGVVDILRGDGYRVRGVQFAERADDDQTYERKRDEMWGRMRAWLEDGGALPNDKRLKEDLISPEFDYTLKGAIKLESKKEMKKRGLSSPDLADALALTFAVNVNEYASLGAFGDSSKASVRRFNAFDCVDKPRW